MHQGTEGVFWSRHDDIPLLRQRSIQLGQIAIAMRTAWALRVLGSLRRLVCTEVNLPLSNCQFYRRLYLTHSAGLSARQRRSSLLLPTASPVIMNPFSVKGQKYTVLDCRVFLSYVTIVVSIFFPPYCSSFFCLRSSCDRNCQRRLHSEPPPTQDSAGQPQSAS